ncbi:MAG: hypothetical protein AB1454_06310 [Candidatus Auribacterota bacterium]|jgi:hypothetical protein|uniref:Uncharacterized protein n=1 Tax=Candidatus Auribacter fodinae TaxID=2093366 RepID=A0A3A4QYY6_9BACT|nr:MAG: hypothetical protein C4541_10370 [Candidatus Auribacter fodinae]
MDLKEKIRMMSILILACGMIFIPVGLFQASEIPVLMRFLNPASPMGVGAYLVLFGLVLLGMTGILPDSER